MHRFLLDDDGSNFLGTLGEDWEEVVYHIADHCADEVTTYLICPGAGTWYFPTEVGDRRYPNLEPIYEAGGDPIATLIGHMRERGKEVFLTIRMNDVHNADNPDDPLVPSFRKKHPEMVVDPDAVAEGRANWMSYCLDYSRHEVRDYYLAIITELVERYDINGIQLDWLRFPRHLPGSPHEVWELREHLTEMTASVHELCRARGRNLLVGARIPTHLAGCRYMGLDIAEWTRRGLVDFLVTTPFLTTDFTIPLDDIRDELHGQAVPIYAGFDFNHGGQAHCPESLRAAMLSLFNCGADGIYLFNFPCWTEHIGSTPYHWLDDLGTAESSKRKPLLFSLSHQRHRIAGVDQPGILPFEIAAGATKEVRINLPAGVFPARRFLMLISSSDVISVDVNKYDGKHMPVKHPCLFLEHQPRGAELPEDNTCYIFRLDLDALRHGNNVIRVTNQSGEPVSIARVNAGVW
jgi:hypothetical protein